VRQDAREQVDLSGIANARNYNRNTYPQVYREDDLVFVTTSPPRGARNPKLRPRYAGPYRITKLGDHQVTIQTVENQARIPYEAQVHRNQLRPCYETFEDAIDSAPMGPPRRGPGRPRGSRNLPRPQADSAAAPGDANAAPPAAPAAQVPQAAADPVPLPMPGVSEPPQGEESDDPPSATY
jgi:hypothetical protein